MIGRKVLVIDDDVDFADSLAELLSLLGHQVGVAYAADSGIRLAASEAFEVALIDVGLGESNGTDCAQEIARMLPSVRCVLMTGFSHDQLAKRGVDAVDFSVLTKPVSIDDLEASVSLE